MPPNTNEVRNPTKKSNRRKAAEKLLEQLNAEANAQTGRTREESNELQELSNRLANERRDFDNFLSSIINIYGSAAEFMEQAMATIDKLYRLGLRPKPKTPSPKNNDDPPNYIM